MSQDYDEKFDFFFENGLFRAHSIIKNDSIESPRSFSSFATSEARQASGDWGTKINKVVGSMWFLLIKSESSNRQ